jgi:hypothetical protein
VRGGLKNADGQAPVPGGWANVERPELAAQRIVRYAELVGLERVIAGTDCGLGTFSGVGPVYPVLLAQASCAGGWGQTRHPKTEGRFPLGGMIHVFSRQNVGGND